MELVNALEQAGGGIDVVTVGSLRDIAALYNHSPALFEKKVENIYVFAGDAEGTYAEYNVELDETAFLRIMNSGLNIYWIPCFQNGLFTAGNRTSYMQIPHSEIFQDTDPKLLNWFLYRFEMENTDFETWSQTEHDTTEFMKDIRNIWIAPEDYLSSVSLENGDYEMIFSPQKKHFAGIEIYLVNHPEGNSGNLIITILDESNKILNTIKVDLSRVPEADWYKVYTKAYLKKDAHYTLRFSAEGCMTVPHLQSVNSDYLPAETLSGSILLSYAYSEPTFTFQNKVIISMYIIAIWIFMCGYFMNNGRKRYFQQTSVIIFMISVLTWNYMYNSMDIQNGNFAGFQSDSETLVTGMLQAEHTVENLRSAEGYGLGRYCNLKGSLFSYELTYITDDNWLDGYSRTDNKIIVDSNTYSRKAASS
ncbi:MAG: hypothetical protein K1W28_18080 [Lachnospiraceae bacterium]